MAISGIGASGEAEAEGEAEGDARFEGWRLGLGATSASDAPGDDSGADPGADPGDRLVRDVPHRHAIGGETERIMIGDRADAPDRALAEQPLQAGDDFGLIEA